MALAIATINASSDVAYLSFLIGVVSSAISMGIIGVFFDNRKQRYRDLVRWTEHLIDYKDQVVTVSDLVLKTKLSPEECRKFLDKFVVELDGEIKYTESGKLYYQFPTAENLESSQGQKYQRLIKWTEHILNYHDQKVTVSDLVFKTELSPKECQEFLDKFVVELNGEVSHTKSGQIYYQFPTSKNIDIKKLAG